jgi:hypothetical protein
VVTGEPAAVPVLGDDATTGEAAAWAAGVGDAAPCAAWAGAVPVPAGVVAAAEVEDGVVSVACAAGGADGVDEVLDLTISQPATRARAMTALMMVTSLSRNVGIECLLRERSPAQPRAREDDVARRVIWVVVRRRFQQEACHGDQEESTQFPRLLPWL